MEESKKRATEVLLEDNILKEPLPGVDYFQICENAIRYRYIHTGLIPLIIKRESKNPVRASLKCAAMAKMIVDRQ